MAREEEAKGTGDCNSILMSGAEVDRTWSGVAKCCNALGSAKYISDLRMSSCSSSEYFRDLMDGVGGEKWIGVEEIGLLFR